MATTISSGRANSPKLTANIADHGTIYGGRGLIFDGVTDYLDCGNLGLSGSYGSISVWININTSASADGVIISGCDDSANTNNLFFYYDEPGEQLAVVNSSTKITGGTTDINDGQWHHAVLTSDGSAYKIYLDGKEESLTVVSGSNNGNWWGDVSGIDLWTIGIHDRTTDIFYGSMADLKIFDATLTEAQVQELYLKPEQSAPSAVQDNMVAWYPMCEGNPDSPQSIVYDHSEKGKLGSDIVINGTFDSDITGWSSTNIDSNRTLTHATVDGRTCIDMNDQDVGGGAGRLSVYHDLGTSLNHGVVYKISYYARKSETDSTNKHYIVALGHQYVGITAGSVFKSVSEYDTWEYHELFILSDSNNDSLWFLSTSSGSGTYNDHKGRLFIDDVKVQEVLMGNHATTNFFGDELITATADRDMTSDTGYWDDSASATTYDATNDEWDVSSTAGGGDYDIIGHNSGSLATVSGKTYSFSFEIKNYVSGSVIFGLGSSYSSVFSGNGTKTGTIVANANGSVRIRTATASSANQTYSIDNISIKEVGVSSSGFATADSEPTIPQVPLLRYNEKMVFDGVDNGVTATVGSAVLSSYTISCWIVASELSAYSRLVQVDDSTYRYLGLHSDGKIISGYSSGGWSELMTSATISAGELHHIVLVDNDTNTTIYIDGVAETISNSIQVDGADFIIGKYSTTNSFSGIIDDVSYFNTALSATEVQELFNDGVALDATTHSKKDYLLGYWRNDGVSSWVDRAPEKMAFDGTDDRVRYGNLINGFTSLTMASWFRVNTSSSTQNDIIGQFTNATTIGARLQSRAGSAGIWWATGNGSSSTIAIYSDSGAHRDGNWHHVVGTYDGSTLKLYFDGATTPVATASSSGLTFNDTNGFDIGGTYPEYMDGNIDECALWNTALTGTEVAELYALGLDGNILTHSNQTNLVSYWKNEGITTASWADKKGSNNPSSVAGSPTLIGGNNGTPAGSPESIIVREGLNSNKDGLGFPFKWDTKNCFRIPSGTRSGTDPTALVIPDSEPFNPHTGSFSIEFWVRSEETNQIEIIEKQGTGGGYQFIANSSSGKIRWEIWDADGVGGVTMDTTSDFNDGDWHHIVGIRDYDTSGGIMQIWFDGSQEGSNADASGIDDVKPASDIWIGGGNTAKVFQGIVDEVRYYSKALSSAEISKNYKHGKGKHKN